MILEAPWEIVARVTVQQQSAGPRMTIGLDVMKTMDRVLLMKIAVMETNVLRVFARSLRAVDVILSRVQVLYLTRRMIHNCDSCYIVTYY